MSQQSHDKVTVYLAIESAVLEPSVISEKLGIGPDRHWLNGEPRGKTGKLWNCHGWVMEVTARGEQNGGASASELLPIALKTFEGRLAALIPNLPRLGSLAEKYVVASMICAYIPAIDLKPSFLRLLSEVGGTFQIDLQT